MNALVIYTGSDDGQVQITKDGGKTWTNITSSIPGVPAQTYVSTVLPSKHKAGRVYVTFDGHYTDDYKPYVFVSEDFGATWRSLSNGLPETSINRIREHPRSPRVLVLAHERGVHFSNDGGATWHVARDEHADGVRRRRRVPGARQRARPRHARPRHLGARRRRSARGVDR